MSTVDPSVVSMANHRAATFRPGRYTPVIWGRLERVADHSVVERSDTDAPVDKVQVVLYGSELCTQRLMRIPWCCNSPGRGTTAIMWQGELRPFAWAYRFGNPPECWNRPAAETAGTVPT